jgi:hypothetical protein
MVGCQEIPFPRVGGHQDVAAKETTNTTSTTNNDATAGDIITAIPQQQVDGGSLPLQSDNDEGDLVVTAVGAERMSEVVETEVDDEMYDVAAQPNKGDNNGDKQQANGAGLISKHTLVVPFHECPPSFRGQLKKLVRGMMQDSWEDRFFILDRGHMVYYEPEHW